MIHKRKKNIFSEETIKSLTELGDVLRGIHNRLLKEGVIKIKNGKVVWPKNITK